jgi:hypothetical protein
LRRAIYLTYCDAAGRKHLLSVLKILSIAMAASALYAMFGSNEAPIVAIAPPPGISVYCSTFQDPKECEEQRGVQAKYWTIQELRQQLWGTMQALAELELRENQHYGEQSKAEKEESQMFDYFRKMMASQV